MPNQFQPSFGQPVQSQYRGLQKTFQPSGTVQSFYNTQRGSNPQPQSYHGPGYVGNQPDHDVAKRADSTRPSNFSTGRAQRSAAFAGAQGVSTFGNVQGAFSGAGASISQQRAGAFQSRAPQARPSAFAAGRAQGTTGAFSGVQGAGAYGGVQAGGVQPGTNFVPANQFTNQFAGQSQQFRNF
ncbi:hypothetical protein [Paenibacillus alkalitolerans]|uniref:hypothetical protein n=1 Tax=Paenibacillus alkalitolerans TaxID=2799335 RepID=UPI0018F4AAFE|nr:hypothetical protein [Paenibacillus alkalitolerans]